MVCIGVKLVAGLVAVSTVVSGYYCLAKKSAPAPAAKRVPKVAVDSEDEVEESSAKPKTVEATLLQGKDAERFRKLLDEGESDMSDDETK